MPFTSNPSRRRRAKTALAGLATAVAATASLAGTAFASGPTHAIAVSPFTNLKYSTPAGCGFRAPAPACTTPQQVQVAALPGAFPASANVSMVLCNTSVFASDPLAACDYANGRGLDVVNDAVMTTAGGGIPATPLQMPSTKALSGSPGHTDSHAVCPPTAAQLAAGHTCSVVVTTADQQHRGTQAVYFKATLTVTPKVPTPNITNITLDGKSFACGTVANAGQAGQTCSQGELVHLYLNNQLLGGVVANTDGTFHMQLPIPNGFGKFTYKAVGVTSGLIATGTYSNMPS
jgi:hypothetical protein